MCGIIGYIGTSDAKNILLEGLQSLEYRGYDSAGIALVHSGTISVIKETGKVAKLKERAQRFDTPSHCGIGHTRWATHGGVSRENAHPHRAGDVVLIHNGIIENYQELINCYGLSQYMESETDSEAAAWLLNDFYQKSQNPKEAIKKLVSEITGSYALCIVFKDYPDEIYAIRNTSPLVAFSNESGSFAASDLTALIPYTKSYVVIPEDTIIKMTKNYMEGTDLNGNPAALPALSVTWTTEAAQKNGYPHFMLKEIHEQPKAFLDTVIPRIAGGVPSFKEDRIPDSILEQCQRIHIVACGTAMHAGMAAKAYMEPLLRLPVTVSIASEFRYETPLIDENTLVILISQSGETIDTLAALKLARSFHTPTLSVVNVKGSTIARESDYVLYTHAGPEIAVASTKAYTVQIAALYLLGCRIALVKGRITEHQAKSFVSKLLSMPEVMKEAIGQQDRIKEMVTNITAANDAFYIGRGLDYAFSLEGALKLKEISYIHAEAYAAGELKHGTIALIEKGIPVIAIATQNHIYHKTMSNIREVKARNAFVILITKGTDKIEPNLYDIHLQIPDTEDVLAVFPLAVMLQLIAYYAAENKNLPVDQPRNLAKSVTVE